MLQVSSKFGTGMMKYLRVIFYGDRGMTPPCLYSTLDVYCILLIVVNI